MSVLCACFSLCVRFVLSLRSIRYLSQCVPLIGEITKFAHFCLCVCICVCCVCMSVFSSCNLSSIYVLYWCLTTRDGWRANNYGLSSMFGLYRTLVSRRKWRVRITQKVKCLKCTGIRIAIPGDLSRESSRLQNGRFRPETGGMICVSCFIVEVHIKSIVAIKCCCRTLELLSSES